MKKKIVLQGAGLHPAQRCSDPVPRKPIEVLPIYDRPEDYDPVLRSHCRMDGETKIFPQSATRQAPRRIV